MEKFFIFFIAFTVCLAKPDVSHVINNAYLPPDINTPEYYASNIQSNAQKQHTHTNSKKNFAEIESIQPSIQIASFSIRTEVPLNQLNLKTQQSQPFSSNNGPPEEQLRNNAPKHQQAVLQQSHSLPVQQPLLPQKSHSKTVSVTGDASNTYLPPAVPQQYFGFQNFAAQVHTPFVSPVPSTHEHSTATQPAHTTPSSYNQPLTATVQTSHLPETTAQQSLNQQNYAFTASAAVQTPQKQYYSVTTTPFPQSYSPQHQELSKHTVFNQNSYLPPAQIQNSVQKTNLSPAQAHSSSSTAPRSSFSATYETPTSKKQPLIASVQKSFSTEATNQQALTKQNYASTTSALVQRPQQEYNSATTIPFQQNYSSQQRKKAYISPAPMQNPTQQPRSSLPQVYSSSSNSPQSSFATTQQSNTPAKPHPPYESQTSNNQHFIASVQKVYSPETTPQQALSQQDYTSTTTAQVQTPQQHYIGTTTPFQQNYLSQQQKNTYNPSAPTQHSVQPTNQRTQQETYSFTFNQPSYSTTTHTHAPSETDVNLPKIQKSVPHTKIISGSTSVQPRYTNSNSQINFFTPTQVPQQTYLPSFAYSTKPQTAYLPASPSETSEGTQKFQINTEKILVDALPPSPAQIPLPSQHVDVAPYEDSVANSSPDIFFPISTYQTATTAAQPSTFHHPTILENVESSPTPLTTQQTLRKTQTYSSTTSGQPTSYQSPQTSSKDNVYRHELPAAQNVNQTPNFSQQTPNLSLQTHNFPTHNTEAASAFAEIFSFLPKLSNQREIQHTVMAPGARKVDTEYDSSGGYVYRRN